MDGLGGLGHGVQSRGQMLEVQEEGPLEAGEQPLGENWAKGRPEQEQGVEEAGWSQETDEGAPGEGALGGEGPTWRWVR